MTQQIYLPLRPRPPIGEIELWEGPMFAAKSDRLIFELRHRGKYGRQNWQLFHPDVNWRDDDMCKSRNGPEEPSTPFRSTPHLRELVLPETRVVAIDETQFAGRDIVRFMIELRDQGYDVLVTALDYDFRGNPFPVTAAIHNVADITHRLHAWCTRCGRRARWSQLLERPPVEGNIVVGHNYEARCEKCFEPAP